MQYHFIYYIKIKHQNLLFLIFHKIILYKDSIKISRKILMSEGHSTHMDKSLPNEKFGNFNSSIFSISIKRLYAFYHTFVILIFLKAVLLRLRILLKQTLKQWHFQKYESP